VLQLYDIEKTTLAGGFFVVENVDATKPINSILCSHSTDNRSYHSTVEPGNNCGHSSNTLVDSYWSADSSVNRSCFRSYSSDNSAIRSHCYNYCCNNMSRIHYYGNNVIHNLL